MRIVECIKSFQNFVVGHSYVMPEDTEEYLRNVKPGTFGMSHAFDPHYRPVPDGTDMNGKSILIFRFGGIGDMLFVEPCLRWYKKRYPQVKIIFATANPGPLMSHPSIDEIHPMPFDLQIAKAADYHLYFQGIIEGNPEAIKNIHAVDMFFRYFGVDSTWINKDDKCPMIFLTESEKEWRDEVYAKRNLSGHFLIGIQLDTSSTIRNFPKDKLKTVIDILSSEPNVKVCLIGTKEQEIAALYYKGNHNSVVLCTDYTVRQQIALASGYDMVLGPDSFMIQVAGAFQIPVVGLYGPFSSKTRMGYFTDAIGLDPECVCAPCGIHGFMPCPKGFPSPCFSLIRVEDILLALNSLKVKADGKPFSFIEGTK